MIEYRIKIENEDLYFTGIEDHMEVNVTTNKEIALIFFNSQVDSILELLNNNTDFNWVTEWVEN